MNLKGIKKQPIILEPTDNFDLEWNFYHIDSEKI